MVVHIWLIVGCFSEAMSLNFDLNVKSPESTVFSFNAKIYYTPRSMKLKGVYWFHIVRLCFYLRHLFMHGLFVSWGTTGWQFVINSRANIHVIVDYWTILPLMLGVVTRQKLQISGSVVLGADESPWPCSAPSWLTPLSWMILRKQKNLRLFSSQYICVFLWDVHLSICGQNRVRSVSSAILAKSISYLHTLPSNFRRCVVCEVFFFKIQKY